VSTLTNRFFRRALLAVSCLSGGLTLGCAGRNSSWQDSGYPNAPARTIIAEPGGYEDVYVADQQYQEQVVDGRQVVGYDTLSDGTRVEVVQYVHTYEDPIDTYPRVYWGGSWYYNVNGDFVYWSPGYGGWVYYWGPPVPLVSCWNAYYPWAPYYWGVGFYGAGWYWGGVGYYGYHAYGVPVVNHYHHHHQQWADANPGGPSSGHPGGPTNQPSPGGPTDDGPARRDKPDRAPVAERDKPPAGAPARDGDPARRNVAPSRADAGDRIAGDPAKRDVAPSRTPTRDDVAPSRAEGGDRVAGAAPERKPTRTVPVRSYTSGTGQRVTTIDPSAGRVAAQRSPSAPPLRQSRSLGTVQQGPRDPFSSRTTQPRWDQPAATPSRDFSADTRSAGRSSPSAPSRSFSPSSSGPSRASSPSPSAPSRSFSPSRSSSSSSRTMSPPSRSSSSGFSSSSRSSGGGGGRSFSPSSSGGGRSSGAMRSSGGGGGGHSSGASRSSGGGGGGRSSGSSRR
jgi:hypothetical protein